MSTLRCPACGGLLEHADDCLRVGNPCLACGAQAEDRWTEPACGPDCPLVEAAQALAEAAP